jgi:sulfate permease, SulP family
LKLPFHLPRRGDLKGDTVAGLTVGLAQIPNAMAMAILATIQPVYGLNTLVVGTPLGSLFTGSGLMTVTTTAAMALATADALSDVSGSQQIGALLMLTLLVGAFQLVFGLLRLGWVTRFVSNGVMVGFVTGISVLIVLSQLGDLTGYSSDYSNKVAKTIDLVFNLDQIDWPTLLVGLATIGLIVLLGRTRVRKFAMVIAFAVSTAVVAIGGWTSIALVSSIGAIPDSLPSVEAPHLELLLGLLVPALAVAIIGLVQGAGVSHSVPNRDGTYGDPSRDFVGQGVANLAGGFFRGMPIGGSVSASALNVSSGARSRWAGVYAGLFVAIALLLFSGVIEMVPLTTVAALLIVAGVGSLRPDAVTEVWRVNKASRAAMVLTLTLTLTVPIQYAVLTGVVIATMQYLYSSSLDVRVRQLVPRSDGSFEERRPPERVPDESVTLLDIYGSVFYAATTVLEGLLPDPLGSRRGVVVLRLRGRGHLGSSAIDLMKRYATALQRGGGTLILEGVDHDMREQLDRTGVTDLLGEEAIFRAHQVVFKSAAEALEYGQHWLDNERAHGDDGDQEGR